MIGSPERITFAVTSGQNSNRWHLRSMPLMISFLNALYAVASSVMRWPYSRLTSHASSQFATRFGPIFANLVLADEINRAPPKVQSALLEAMQERQVTIGDKSYALPRPFLVLATQNPIE